MIPINCITLEDVEALRKRPYDTKKPIHVTDQDVAAMHARLSQLYDGRITFAFAFKLAILNQAN